MTRLVVLGGSGASTPELFEALDAWPGGPDRRPELDVVLAGRTAGKLELVARACRARRPARGPSVSVRTETDRRRALEGADIVLNQVRVGGLAARLFDESFPWAFGLPGEETLGPGGFANALRTVPVVLEGFRDIAEVAPSALVVNLTNPAGIVQAAALRTTALTVHEVCDSPIVLLAAIAARLGRRVEDVRRRYVGMNHLGWYVPESPDELERIADLATGMSPEVVRLQEALPQPYVRYYLHPDRILEVQRGKETRAQALGRLETEQLVAYESGSAADAPRRGAAWYSAGVIPLLDGWLNGSDVPLVVGVANDPADEGAPVPGEQSGNRMDRTTGRPIVAGLPTGVVVEASVTFPVPGHPEVHEPPALLALPSSLLAAHATYERLTVDALVGDMQAGERREALLRALVANPMVQTYDQAVGLLDAILAHAPA